MKRREFVTKTGMAVVGISAMNPTKITPFKSDVVNMGIIGTGARGGGLIPHINDIQGLKVAGCCDVLPFRLESGLSQVNGKA